MEGTKVSENMESLNSEPIISKVKVKQDSPDTDMVAKDIKSRLSLLTTDNCDKRQTNGVHQMNGTCDSPQKSPGSTCNEVESKNVETSHTNRSGKQ